MTDQKPTRKPVSPGEKRENAISALNELRAECSHPPTDGGRFDELYMIILDALDSIGD